MTAARQRTQAGDDHSQRWRRNNPVKNRQYYLASVYGITPAEYDALLVKQRGVCAICGSDKPGRARASFFSVDHDHETGQVRGLLCHRCNLMLGHSRDHVGVLERAIEYLKSHSQ